MSCNQFSTKDPAESIILTFDFTNALDGEEQLTSIQSVSVTTSAGNDPNPDEILVGSTLITVSGMMAQIPVRGGLDGVNYNVKVICTTSNENKVLALTGTLPVRAQ